MVVLRTLRKVKNDFKPRDKQWTSKRNSRSWGNGILKRAARKPRRKGDRRNSNKSWIILISPKWLTAYHNQIIYTSTLKAKSTRKVQVKYSEAISN